MYFSENFVFERTFTSDEQSDPNIKKKSFFKSFHSGNFPALPCSPNVVQKGVDLLHVL